MEIKFNPSSVPDPLANQPVARRSEASSVPDQNALANVDALKKSLTDLPLVRPDKVANARSLANNPHYPPGELLDRIANLMAVHINK